MNARFPLLAVLSAAFLLAACGRDEEGSEKPAVLVPSPSGLVGDTCHINLALPDDLTGGYLFCRDADVILPAMSPDQCREITAAALKSFQKHTPTGELVKTCPLPKGLGHCLFEEAFEEGRVVRREFLYRSEDANAGACAEAGGKWVAP